MSTKNDDACGTVHSTERPYFADAVIFHVPMQQLAMAYEDSAQRVMCSDRPVN